MSDPDPIVQAVAEALRKSRMPWGTHSDRWGDAAWQHKFWTEVAELAVATARPLIERETKAEAIATLREFARAQDTWCEAGRADQLIRRAAMRDALLREADRIEQEGQ